VSRQGECIFLHNQSRLLVDKMANLKYKGSMGWAEQKERDKATERQRQANLHQTMSCPSMTTVVVNGDTGRLLARTKQSIEQRFNVTIDVNNTKADSIHTPRSEQSQRLTIVGEKSDCDRARVSLFYEAYVYTYHIYLCWISSSYFSYSKLVRIYIGI